MATFNIKHDRHYLKLNPNTGLNEIEKSLLEIQWDHETEYDFQIIKKEVETIKKIKKMCLVKLFTFLPEAFVANVVYPKKENKIRRAMNRLYFRFLFNKIDYNTFKKELLHISKDDIMLV